MLEQTMRQRRVKRVGTVVQVLIALLMIALIVLAYQNKDGSVSPLFLPFPAIILVVVMCGFLMNVVSIIFNAAEIGVVDTAGRKFMVSQHGMRVARATGIIVLILFIVFLLLIPYVETAISTDEREPIDLSTIKVDTFDNIDEFDAEYAERVIIDVQSGPDVHYALYYKESATNTFEEKNVSVVPSGTVGYIPIKDYPRGEYKVELFIEESGNLTESDVIYKIERHINPDLELALTWFLLVIAIANIAWTVVTYVLMRKYETASVGGLADLPEFESE
jgi:hypothetical protein